MNANTSAIQGLLPSLRSYGIVCERLRKTRLAPRAGFEPATNRLTAGCSTTELPGNGTRVTAYNRAARLCLVPALPLSAAPDGGMGRPHHAWDVSPHITEVSS